tara:strand:- start:1131 stop:1406 length:276 start_codon:yes stop_codon:yes gene_type:complete
MRPEHIEYVLMNLHEGQWFGFSDPLNKTYENIEIYSEHEKPTKEWLEEELKTQQDAWDAEEIARPARLASVKTKLESLGLTTEELKEAFGL